MAACCTSPTNNHLLPAKLYKKAHLLMKNIEDFSEKKKSLVNGPVGRKKEKTERPMEAGRGTREEIVN